MSGKYPQSHLFSHWSIKTDITSIPQSLFTVLFPPWIIACSHWLKVCVMIRLREQRIFVMLGAREDL